MRFWMLLGMCVLLALPVFGAEGTPPANDFGFRLLQNLAKGAPDKNVFISPVSIETALAMTANGAKGDTFSAMLKTLGMEGWTLDKLNTAQQAQLTNLQREDSGLRVNIANSLWVDTGTKLLEDYQQRVQRIYTAEVQSAKLADPATAQRINDWTKAKTQGLIPEIVKPADLQAAVLALLNAVYFKGKWQYPFPTEKTKDGTFTAAGGKQLTLPMMRQAQIKSFPYTATANYQAVALPYKDGTMRMVVVLPKDGTTLAQVVAGMNAAKWKTLSGALQRTEVDLTLPRFSTSYRTLLNDPLKALGMGTAFDGRADFTGMVEGGGIFIGKMIHKARMIVSEEGTEAAAVTAVIMDRGMPRDPVTMSVNRPFLCAIEDTASGTLLFVGAINVPEK